MIKAYPPAGVSLLSRGAGKTLVSLKKKNTLEYLLLSRRFLDASLKQLVIKRKAIKMTDLFSVNAIQTHFSQFTLQKRGEGQMLTKGKGNREGDTDASICSRSPLWHEEIAPYLLSWESPRTLKRSEKGVTPLLPSSSPWDAVGKGGCAWWQTQSQDQDRTARACCTGVRLPFISLMLIFFFSCLLNTHAQIKYVHHGV